MKKCFLLLLLSLFCLGLKAQTPTTCSAAVSLSFPFVKDTTKDYGHTEKWYSLTLSVGNYNLSITNYKKFFKLRRDTESQFIFGKLCFSHVYSNGYFTNIK